MVLINGVLEKNQKMEKVNKIIIIPAIFLKKTKDGYICRCYIEKGITEDKLFSKYSLKGMKNPKYLFLGIIIGVGWEQINFYDANAYEETFKLKWKSLMK
jgi:hypothetical protein